MRFDEAADTFSGDFEYFTLVGKFPVRPQTITLWQGVHS